MMTKFFDKGAVFFCAVMMAIFFMSGCAATRTVNVPQESGDYTLGVGDALRINVYGQEELTGEFKIDPKGDISFPLVQSVPAAGFTTAELEQNITEKLDPQYIVDPLVSVEVATYRGVYVLGEVQQPGKYEYAPNMTALQAIASAGGHTYRANEGSAELTRHVKGAMKTFTIDQMATIKPGDTIVVKRRWF